MDDSNTRYNEKGGQSTLPWTCDGSTDANEFRNDRSYSLNLDLERSNEFRETNISDLNNDASLGCHLHPLIQDLNS